MIRKLRYQSMDVVLYSMMNWIQWKLRHHATTKNLFDAYLDECTPLNRTDFFAIEPMKEVIYHGDKISWKSPHQDVHHENNQAQSLFFPASHADPSAPTLIILHALMSAGDQGYRDIAAQINQQGWNVLFPYLPFHYSRSPKNHYSGALAITADLVRNGETLRQAVKEIRQLMAWSRTRGSRKIGLLATSYGGWIASLLMSLEPVYFAILLQPIIDIGYATFQSPLSRVIASLLKKQGITSADLDRHAHLTGPKHGQPQCAPERLMIIGSSYDKISPPHQLRDCCDYWNGSIYHEVEQGHFGHDAMKLALKVMKPML